MRVRMCVSTAWISCNQFIWFLLHNRLSILFVLLDDDEKRCGCTSFAQMAHCTLCCCWCCLCLIAPCCAIILGWMATRICEYLRPIYFMLPFTYSIVYSRAFVYVTRWHVPFAQIENWIISTYKILPVLGCIFRLFSRRKRVSVEFSRFGCDFSWSSKIVIKSTELPKKQNQQMWSFCAFCVFVQTEHCTPCACICDTHCVHMWKVRLKWLWTFF